LFEIAGRKKEKFKKDTGSNFTNIYGQTIVENVLKLLMVCLSTRQRDILY
jgi:hypothetical protein